MAEIAFVAWRGEGFPIGGPPVTRFHGSRLTTGETMKPSTNDDTRVVSEQVIGEPQPIPGETFRHFMRRRREAVRERLFQMGYLCMCGGMVVIWAVSGRCRSCGKVVEVHWNEPWPKPGASKA